MNVGAPGSEGHGKMLEFTMERGKGTSAFGIEKARGEET